MRDRGAIAQRDKTRCWSVQCRKCGCWFASYDRDDLQIASMPIEKPVEKQGVVMFGKECFCEGFHEPPGGS